MKTLLLAIVSSIGIGAGIAALMIFGNISPALPPSHDWNSGTLIDMPGLSNTYQVGNTAKFSILIRGFTNHRCTTPAIMLYEDSQPDRPILNYSVSLMSCPINDTSSYTLYLPSKSDNFSATFERPGPYTLDILFDKNESIQTHFLVTGPKITYYYDGSTIKPKVELYDYYYNGIDKDNATVSINNQTYYQTTLNYADYDLKKGTSILFQNVTFAFPEGVMATPGGAFIMLDITFPNGAEEIYGENKKNPDGSGVLGGIGIPTQYGPHLSTNSTTVLGNHVMPQAGMTIYNDKIKLLVSVDDKTSTENNAMVNKITTDLHNVYYTDDKIDFSINFIGFVQSCDYPHVEILDSNNDTTWKGNNLVQLCDPEMGLHPVYVNQTYNLSNGLGGPIMINQTGDYTTHITFYDQILNTNFTVIEEPKYR